MLAFAAILRCCAVVACIEAAATVEDGQVRTGVFVHSERSACAVDIDPGRSAASAFDVLLL